MGGAVGGFVGLIALAAVVWYFFKKSSANAAFDNMFNKDEDPFRPSNHNHQDLKPGPLDGEVAETGYKYGLLGNETGNLGNATGHAPGHPGAGGQELGYQPYGADNVNDVAYNPHMNETGYNPAGNEAGYNPNMQDTGYNAHGNEQGYTTNTVDSGAYGSDSMSGHNRSHSAAPLLGALGAAAAGATAYAVATTSSTSRPSTGGSGQPLMGGASYSQQGHGSASQGYGNHLNTYPPQGAYSQSSQGYYGGAGSLDQQQHQHQGYSGTTLSPNPSVAASSQWGGGSSISSPSQYSSQSHNMLLPGGAVPGRSNVPAGFNPDHRSGSPVSIQEQRVLQVINPDSGYGFSTSVDSSVLGRASSPPGQAGGSSSSSQAPAAQGTRPMVDGKGRPVDLQGQMVPLVHLDGGAYEEPVVAPARGGVPMPPAYSS